MVDRANAGGFFGELSVLDGVPRSSDAIARSAARLLLAAILLGIAGVLAGVKRGLVS